MCALVSRRFLVNSFITRGPAQKLYWWRRCIVTVSSTRLHTNATGQAVSLLGTRAARAAIAPSFFCGVPSR